MLILLLTSGIIDYKYRKIPDTIIFLIFAWVLFFSSATSFERIAGFLVTAVPLFIFAFTTGKLKGGDYKFLVVCAGALGISFFVEVLISTVVISLIWTFLKSEDSVPLAFNFMLGYIAILILQEVFI
jgi:Flp pilus assembly protein protease CpaA